MTGAHLKYILAILNSRVAQWYFDQIATSSGMGTNRWLKYKIEQLPIPKIEAEEKELIRNDIIGLIDRIVAITKENNYQQQTAMQTQVKEYEMQIDQMVYKLYGLTEDEIKTVEKQTFFSVVTEPILESTLPKELTENFSTSKI
jgi:adenine-specific DNA-methyltransferase